MQSFAAHIRLFSKPVARAKEISYHRFLPGTGNDGGKESAQFQVRIPHYNLFRGRLSTAYRVQS